MGIDEVGIDEVGIDKVGIDEVGINEVGRYPSGSSAKHHHLKLGNEYYIALLMSITCPGCTIAYMLTGVYVRSRN